MNQDEKYMLRALQLAKKGGRAVAPNPMVGAVVVKTCPDHGGGDGEVIGEGYHQVFGGPHAEVKAIESVKNREDLKGATLYVTLEPCRHHGKTPPCANLIESVGIGRVVVGSGDPFQKKYYPSAPLGSAQGENFEMKSIEGPIADQCRELNKFFFTWVEKKRPFITVKIAVSADGFVAGPKGEAIRITSADQDRQVHQLRAEHQAIMVGTQTVLNDDPQLNVRHAIGPDPLRIVLDRQLKIPLTAKVFRDSNVLVATQKWTSSTECPTSVQHKLNWFKERQIQVWESPNDNQIDLKALFVYLAEQGIASVLVEPGPKLYRSLKKLNWIDELIVLKGEKELGEGLKIDL